MSDHTPGPWHAAHRHGDGTAHDDVIGQLGWEVHGPPESGPGCRGQFRKSGDAHLIAAAPDLYDALWVAESALAMAAAYVHREQATMHQALEVARAAITTARGEGSEHDLVKGWRARDR